MTRVSLLFLCGTQFFIYGFWCSSTNTTSIDHIYPHVYRPYISPCLSIIYIPMSIGHIYPHVYQSGLRNSMMKKTAWDRMSYHCMSGTRGTRNCQLCCTHSKSTTFLDLRCWGSLLRAFMEARRWPSAFYSSDVCLFVDRYHVFTEDDAKHTVRYIPNEVTLRELTF